MLRKACFGQIPRHFGYILTTFRWYPRISVKIRYFGENLIVFGIFRTDREIGVPRKINSELRCCRTNPGNSERTSLLFGSCLNVLFPSIRQRNFHHSCKICQLSFDLVKLILKGKPIKWPIYWITCRRVGRWKNFPWILDVRRLSRFARWSFYEAILEMTGIICWQVWTIPHLAESYGISCRNDFGQNIQDFPGV